MCVYLYSQVATKSLPSYGSDDTTQPTSPFPWLQERYYLLIPQKVSDQESTPDIVVFDDDVISVMTTWANSA